MIRMTNAFIQEKIESNYNVPSTINIIQVLFSRIEYSGKLYLFTMVLNKNISPYVTKNGNMIIVTYFWK